MNIFIKELELKNFKGHKSLKCEFSEVVKISGKNGEGKSSIGESITWNLFGTDTMGNTLDPTPIFEFDGELSVSVLVEVEGKVIQLKRAIENGKYTFYINEIPKKATEYKAFVESLFSKELFLSIFTPGYFASQHWKEQREQLLQYVPEPLNKEVLASMTNANREVLEEMLKEKSVSELDSFHKDRYKKREIDIQRAGARLETLREQLEKSLGSKEVNLDDVKTALEEVTQELTDKEAYNKSVAEVERKLQNIENQMNHIREQTYLKAELVESLENQHLPELCHECGQALDYNAKEETRKNHQKRIYSVKMEGKDLVLELRNLKELKESLTVTEKHDLTGLYEISKRYQRILLDKERIEDLEREVKEAQKAYDFIRFERNESLGIVNAVKEFVEQKAALMVNQVNDLFPSLTVKLFEKQKNEAIKQTFEIELEGKPYQKLSTAEKVKAGIELICVLQKQSGVTSPTFIDNAESVLNLKIAPGQALVSIVRSHKLKIEGGKAA
ncbi:AAA family ATPase [Lysinibacillus fusiformis]|uniref:AAA family ATPase n=1 Tax=Lysinibacillus fusiformis TaxID=28031 RepID=UPI003CFE9FA0